MNTDWIGYAGCIVCVIGGLFLVSGKSEVPRLSAAVAAPLAAILLGIFGIFGSVYLRLQSGDDRSFGRVATDFIPVAISLHNQSHTGGPFTKEYAENLGISSKTPYGNWYVDPTSTGRELFISYECVDASTCQRLAAYISHAQAEQDPDRASGYIPSLRVTVGAVRSTVTKLQSGTALLRVAYR